MINEFNKLPWHDAELKKIIIERQDKDIIKISIKWPKYSEANNSIIEFYDCYSFRADMNFGIVPPDCILSAECIIQSEELDELKSLWQNIGVKIPELHLFKILTNSTNSTINIFALGFRIIDGYTAGSS